MTGPTVSVSFALIASVALSGCLELRRESTRGYVFDEEVVEQLRPGVDNKQSVSSALGNPTAASTFRDNVWYYISQKQVKLAFLPQETTGQKVVKFVFDNEGYFEEMERYTLADARSVDPRDDETPARGRTMNFFEQLFSNIGRFSAAPGQAGRGGPGRR